MKIEQLADIATMLAKCHPNSDVKVCYTVKHGNGRKFKFVDITGHRVSILSEPKFNPTITFEVDHARSREASEDEVK